MSDAHIVLSNGMICIVDKHLFDKISEFKWSATFNSTKWYAVRNEKGKRIYLHRWVMKASGGDVVDHKNNNSLDNRISNLRFANKSLNGANSSKQKRETSSKFKGVHWHRKLSKWRAKITVNGKTISLGCYSSEKDACAAYGAAAKRYFGEFAKISSRVD